MLNDGMNIYGRKLLRSFFAIFVLFLIVILLIFYNRERNYKKNTVVARLGTCAGVVAGFIASVPDSLSLSGPLKDFTGAYLGSCDMRITVIDKDGTVIFDSSVDDVASLENHAGRKEVLTAGRNGHGTDIRKSESTGIDYLYYAERSGGYYIRTAMPLDSAAGETLGVDIYFTVFLIFVFLSLTFFLVYFSDSLGKNIMLLRKFAASINTGTDPGEEIDFGDSELGEIGRKIQRTHRELIAVKNKLNVEKDKLIRHLSVTGDGIGVFSASGTPIFVNSSFHNLINLVLPEGYTELTGILSSQDRNLKKDLSALLSAEVKSGEKGRMIGTQVNRDGKYIEIEAVFFMDRSFAVYLRDVTEPESRRIMKQQMTSNIAHELKTPVAAVSGMLETIIEHKDLGDERKEDFIKRSYSQIQRLKNLIDDIGKINRMDESPGFLKTERVDLQKTTEMILSDLEPMLVQKNVKYSLKGLSGRHVNGSRELIESIFKNLIDNSIKYAGENILINLDLYHEDSENYYFRYSDNGSGLPKEHLNRIFERFYRIDKGRSRELGGTGLGLSIVRNAVRFHGGDIVARLPEKGLEFSFSLKKDISS